MFIPMLKNETKKLSKRSLLWAELGIIATLTIAIFIMMYVLTAVGAGTPEELAQLEQFITWPQSFGFTLALASSSNLGGLLVVVMVGVVVAQEYDWQAFSLWLRQGATRPTVLAAKLLALMGGALAIVLVTLAAGTIASGIVTVLINGSLDVSVINVDEVLLSIVRTAYTLLPYLSLTFLVAILTRSVAASVGFGVGYALLVEGIALQLLATFGGELGQFAKYMPGQMAASIANLNAGITNTSTVQVGGETTVIAPNLLAPNAAAVGIAIYTVLFIGAAVWVFHKQDITT